MSARDDGGPAFPNAAYTHPGMSLRDYFAAQAMPAVIRAAMQAHVGDTPWSKVSEISYAIADAMLAARKEPTR